MKIVNQVEDVVIDGKQPWLPKRKYINTIIHGGFAFTKYTQAM